MQELYDKHGRRVMPHDLLRLFHFVGARRKKHYMYKWVVVHHGLLFGNHLSGDNTAFYLSKESLGDFEIVQGYDEGQHFEDRPLRKE